MASVPNIFHFIHGLRKQTEPFPLAHYLCLASCLQVNRPDKIYFYYHYEPHGRYWKAIRPFLTLERGPLRPFVERFRYPDSTVKSLRYAHHADFIRLEKLLERGGVYADIDTLFLRPVPQELYAKPFVIGREGHVQDPKTGISVQSLCNAFLMAEPGAKFARLWLERMEAEFDGSWSNHSSFLSTRLADAYPDLVHLEPQRVFYHFRPTRIGLAALFEDRAEIPEEAISIHLWEHLWWSQQRLDFSHFHGGLLTEEYVRESVTTYSMVARQFLPKALLPPGEIEIWGQRLKPRLSGSIVSAEQSCRAAAGLAAYTLLRHFWPKARTRLGLARGYYAHREAVKRFSVRNAMERAILQQVIEWDEYGVLGDGLEQDDVVIDVGAHIGSFSFVCHWAGCRNVHAFEAHPGNLALAQRNLAGLPGIQLNFGAVFRSDAMQIDCLLHSGPVFSNTGGGGVMFGANHFDFLDHDELKPAGDPLETPVIVFDRILDRFERIRLLKLDCEGSEYPILLTSRQLGKIDRVVGEYHVIPEEKMALVVPAARVDGHSHYGAQTIRKVLEANGFAVTLAVGSEDRGHFDAVRH